jgi:hypothetical protein
MAEKRFTDTSKHLGLQYRSRTNGSIVFEDKTEYAVEELHQMKKIKMRCPNNSKIINAIHKLKKAFDADIDFVYVY